MIQKFRLKTVDAHRQYSKNRKKETKTLNYETPTYLRAHSHVINQ